MTNDTSPNGLHIQPNAAKASKWPFIFVGLALCILGGVLYYSINIAHVETEQEAVSKKADIQEVDEPLWLVEGSGLTLDADKEQVSGVSAPPAPAPIPEPIVIVRGADTTEEAQHIRRLQTQAYVSALSAPLLSKRVTTPEAEKTASPDAMPYQYIAGQTPGQTPTRAIPIVPGQNNYDPSSDVDKEQFLQNRARQDTQWTLPHERMAGSPYEIKTGAVIPGVMVTGINSDLPGQIIAQVSQNVFDTHSGRHLLIPQGTKLFGVYDSRVMYGQSRVLVAWNRLIFPDGSSLSIEAMAGADMSGYGGYEDEVNNHYFRIFGSALLMSLIMGGTAYAVDSGAGDNEASLQSQMTSALAQQLGQTTTSLLQKNLNIKPTLEVRPGYQFNIVVSKDMIFREPYKAIRY